MYFAPTIVTNVSLTCITKPVFTAKSSISTKPKTFSQPIKLFSREHSSNSNHCYKTFTTSSSSQWTFQNHSTFNSFGLSVTSLWKDEPYNWNNPHWGCKWYKKVSKQLLSKLYWCRSAISRKFLGSFRHTKISIRHENGKTRYVYSRSTVSKL